MELPGRPRLRPDQLQFIVLKDTRRQLYSTPCSLSMSKASASYPRQPSPTPPPVTSFSARMLIASFVGAKTYIHGFGKESGTYGSWWLQQHPLAEGNYLAAAGLDALELRIVAICETPDAPMLTMSHRALILAAQLFPAQASVLPGEVGATGRSGDRRHHSISSAQYLILFRSIVWQSTSFNWTSREGEDASFSNNSGFLGSRLLSSGVHTAATPYRKIRVNKVIIKRHSPRYSPRHAHLLALSA